MVFCLKMCLAGMWLTNHLGLSRSFQTCNLALDAILSWQSFSSVPLEKAFDLVPPYLELTANTSIWQSAISLYINDHVTSVSVQQLSDFEFSLSTVKQRYDCAWLSIRTSKHELQAFKTTCAPNKMYVKSKLKCYIQWPLGHGRLVQSTSHHMCWVTCPVLKLAARHLRHACLYTRLTQAEAMSVAITYMYHHHQPVPDHEQSLIKSRFPLVGERLFHIRDDWPFDHSLSYAGRTLCEF